ncbi:MAG: cobalamin biosynthesis protein CobQ [Rhodobacteraceae bacterium]|nr:cobalamin biosynthesis protein CobQ [Paracoccaceae bacterium]
MNTPAHLIFGAAAFARPGVRHGPAAAVLGSLVPDISLYVMVAISIWGMGISPHRVFDELYFSDLWQNVFAVDNSFILWGLLLAFALWRCRPALAAFAKGGLLHLATDFPLHNEDARRQFWPVSDWVFRSPFSYYDPHRYGNYIGPLEVALCLVFSVLLWRRFPMRSARLLILFGMGLELAPMVLFHTFL